MQSDLFCKKFENNLR